MQRMVLTTPFHERLAPLNQTQLWSHWSGYLSAVKYQMSDKFEYFAVRNAAGLIDTSPLYKYRIGGRDAAKFLGGVLARDIGACRDGQAQYTLWCDERGYVVEDGVVIRFAADDFILTSAEPNLAYFQKPRRLRPGRDHRRVGRLRIAGGAGPAIARDPAPVSIRRSPTLGFFHHGPAKIGNVPVHVSRTGYTGDLGYEIWVGADGAIEMWDALAARHAPGMGVLPVGQSALLMTRIEAGLVLIGVDFHSSRFAFNDQRVLDADRARLRLDVPRPGQHRRGASSDVAAIERELADKTSRWKMVGLMIDWQRLGSSLRRGRPDPAEGRDAGRLRDDAVRRRGEPRRLHHQLHVLADVAAAHRHGPGAARSGQARLAGQPGAHDQPPLPHRRGAAVARPPLFNPPRKTA